MRPLESLSVEGAKFLASERPCGIPYLKRELGLLTSLVQIF